jgi:hypothetical protein
MHRRLLILGAVLVLASSATVASRAGAAVTPPTKVGPNQYFSASIKGQLGVGSPATIHMACFGPLRPGQTGHPMAGQTAEVFRPEVIVSHLGFTGPDATSISAFFNAPPPSPAAASATGAVTFTRYAVPKKIPTSLVLPCAGTGNVYFVPFPGSPIGAATDAVLPVTYVGQP